MKRSLLFTVFFATATILHAQAVRTPVTAVYPVLHAYSNQLSDAFSGRGNIAALAGVQRFSAGVYAERRFMLQELASYSFAAALPTFNGGFGLQGDYYGGSSYNETSLGLGYARKLGNKVNLGLQFEYFSMKTEGYGSASAFTFDAGLIFHLTEALQTGLHTYNPVRMKIGKSGEEKLASVYGAGLGYDVSPQLFIGAEIQKTEDRPLNVNGGLHYRFAQNFLARAGFSSATAVYYIGFGVTVKSFRVDVTSSFHPYLGPTPGLLLMYSPVK